MAGVAGGDRNQGPVLRAVQRPRQPFFRDPEGGRGGGQEPPDAGGAGDEGTGGADDPGLFAAGARPVGAQFRDLAGALAAGAAAGGDHARWREPTRFLRERYIAEFNAKFSVAAAEKGTAFRRTRRSDLDWIFTVQTERVVAKDNTVAIGTRSWQIDKTRFRHTLAGSTVTIHEHLDETVSIRYGPHVVGRYEQHGRKADQRDNQRAPWKRREHGSRRKPKAGFHRLPHSLGNLARSARFPLSHRADYGFCFIQRKAKAKTKTQGGGLTAASLCFTKRTDH